MVDRNADVLWRGADGSLAEWLMNGSTIAGSGLVNANGAAVAPDASWHVVEIGDFNGDARADVLWRNDNGQMAEWLMKGLTIVSSSVPSSGGTPVSPDASWHTQAKSTDFA
jgi:serralysin